MHFPTLKASGAVHSVLLDLGFFLNLIWWIFLTALYTIRCQSDPSEMQNLPNICWVHWESLLDTNVVWGLSEIDNSIYFNKIFLCSKLGCIFLAKNLCLKDFISINLSDVHLTYIIMLFMSCFNAVSAVQSSLFQVFSSQKRCLKMLWMCFSRRFQKLYFISFLVKI